MGLNRFIFPPVLRKDAQRSGNRGVLADSGPAPPVYECRKLRISMDEARPLQAAFRVEIERNRGGFVLGIRRLSGQGSGVQGEIRAKLAPNPYFSGTFSSLPGVAYSGIAFPPCLNPNLQL